MRRRCRLEPFGDEMTGRCTEGQAAMELAIALPLFLLVFGLIYQAAIVALASDEAQMLANRLAAETRAAGSGMVDDPARFIDFGVNKMLPPIEFLRGTEKPPADRLYSQDGWQVRVRTEALLSGAERSLLQNAGTGSPRAAAAATQLMAGLDSGILTISVWRDLAPLPLIRVFHPQPFRVRAQAVGALVERP